MSTGLEENLIGSRVVKKGQRGRLANEGPKTGSYWTFKNLLYHGRKFEFNS